MNQTPPNSLSSISSFHTTYGLTYSKTTVDDTSLAASLLSHTDRPTTGDPTAAAYLHGAVGATDSLLLFCLLYFRSLYSNLGKVID